MCARKEWFLKENDLYVRQQIFNCIKVFIKNNTFRGFMLFNCLFEKDLFNIKHIFLIKTNFNKIDKTKNIKNNIEFLVTKIEFHYNNIHIIRISIKRQSF